MPLKSFEIGYGDNKIRIHPKMVSVETADEFQRQLNDIADSDSDKNEKEFQICRAAIDAFSDRPAEKLVSDKGASKAVAIEGGLTAHFPARTPESDRIVRNAYQIIQSQFMPDSRFI